MKAALLLICGCLLAACGGGGGDTTVDPRAASRSVSTDDASLYANTRTAMDVCTAIRTTFERCGGNFWDATKQVCTSTVAPDEHVYIEMLRVAADKGEPCAQYGLGTLYRTGFPDIGVEPDEAQGLVWLKKAADQGHTLSKQELQPVN